MDVRTHSKSGDRTLCPVLIWSRICKRVSKETSNPRTKVFTLLRGERRLDISSERIVRAMKSIGRTVSNRHPGINVEKIGSRSIRSGAAMALFIKDHHPERIKILGRWSSDAFLVYIRPQVLEWTNLMSRDMVSSQTDEPKWPTDIEERKWGRMPHFL